MDPETVRKINRAAAKYESRQADILTKSAAAAHMSGDITAQGQLTARVSFSVVQKESMDYARSYRKDLVNRGGSMVTDKSGRESFKPWFAESKKKDRDDVFKIIRDGVKEGRAPGTKEYKRGGYPKGSIAADLQGHFNKRRSHAALVARTETARIQWHGTRDRYGKQGVKKVKRLAAKDSRTRPDHVALDGKIYTLGEEPSLGEPNCRCAYAPVIEKPPVVIVDDPKIEEIRTRMVETEDDYNRRMSAAGKAVREQQAEVDKVYAKYNEEVDIYSRHFDEFDAYRKANPGDLEGIRARSNIINDAFEYIENTSGAAYNTALDELTRLTDYRDGLEREKLNALHEILFVRKKPILTLPKKDVFKDAVDLGAIMPAPEDMANGKAGLEFVGRIASKQKLQAVTDAQRKGRFNVTIFNERSHASAWEGICIKSGRPPKTWVHETAHLFEMSDPDAVKRAIAWRDSRRASGVLEKLDDISPGHGYELDELAFRGKYPDAYMGKDYGQYATEVTSMGAEYLYLSPGWMAKYEPELFRVVLKAFV